MMQWLDVANASMSKFKESLEKDKDLSQDEFDFLKEGQALRDARRFLQEGQDQGCFFVRNLRKRYVSRPISLVFLRRRVSLPTR